MCQSWTRARCNWYLASTSSCMFPSCCICWSSVSAFQHYPQQLARAWRLSSCRRIDRAFRTKPASFSICPAIGLDWCVCHNCSWYFPMSFASHSFAIHSLDSSGMNCFARMIVLDLFEEIWCCRWFGSMLRSWPGRVTWISTPPPASYNWTCTVYLLCHLMTHSTVRVAP